MGFFGSFQNRKMALEPRRSKLSRASSSLPIRLGSARTRISLLEEHSVVFKADLGKEIRGRMRPIGNEMETVTSTCQRCHRDLYRCGVLDVTSGKLLHRTAVRHPTKDSRPIDVNRVNPGCYRVSQRTCWSNAVWDCESIQHTNISRVQRTFAQVQISVGTAI